ncbi:MAG: orotate phosphoribosyltransferase [Pseudomonadota bacterium]
MALSPARTVARMLLEAEAVHVRPDRPFALDANRWSPIYIDTRKLFGSPRMRRRLVELLRERVIDDIGFDAFDTVAGGETAGIPLAAWLADALMLPMVYVRKQPKGFGRNARIEGRLTDGQRVLMVDDAAVDGTSKLGFVDGLREAGAVAHHGVVPFAYDLWPAGKSAMAAAGFTLHAIATLRDLLDEVAAGGALPSATLAAVEQFAAAPDAWHANGCGTS